MKAFILLYVLTAFAAYEAEANVQSMEAYRSTEGSPLSFKIKSGNFTIRPSVLPIIKKTDINYPMAEEVKPYLEGQYMIYLSYSF